MRARQFAVDAFDVTTWATNSEPSVRVRGAVITKTGKRHATQEGYLRVLIKDLTEAERQYLALGCAKHMAEEEVRFNRDRREIASLVRTIQDR